MARHGRILLALVSAIAVLSGLAGAASANRLSLSDQTFKARWSGMRFSTEVLTGISCGLTLEGSFHTRSFAKVAGSLIGYVTAATGGRCNEGWNSATLSDALPWHVQYTSFTGALPNITRMNTVVIGFRILITEGFGFSCLYRSTAEKPLVMKFNREAGGTLGGIELEGTLPATEMLCSQGIFGGGSIGVTSMTGAAIRLTLI